MLSSLPTELIREIIESTVPHTFHSKTYLERQRTLCSLSLVSKLFRSIAQPLLSEIVWIKSTSEIDRLPLAGTSRIGKEGRGVKCAVVESSQDEDARSPSAKTASLERALQLLQSATTLAVGGHYDGVLDLSIFETFPNLTQLHLSGWMWSCSRPPILPKIESLTLNDLSFETMEVLLSRSTLPNLKEFALVDNDSDYVEALEKPGFKQLLPQLEALCLDVWIWRDPRAVSLHSAASRTLVDCGSLGLPTLITSGAPVVNLRLYECVLEDTEVAKVCIALDDYAAFITSTPALPLRCVYLDQSFEDGSLLPDELATALTDFSRICHERNIEIVFDSVPDNFQIDPCFPSDFMRRRRASEAGSDAQGSDY